MPGKESTATVVKRSELAKIQQLLVPAEQTAQEAQEAGWKKHQVGISPCIVICRRSFNLIDNDLSIYVVISGVQGARGHVDEHAGGWAQEEGGGDEEPVAAGRAC